MSNTPTRPTATQLREVSAPPTPSDPKVVGFLNQYAALESRVAEQAHDNDELSMQVEVNRREIAYLRTENARLQRERDEFQGGYLEMKCQVATLASNATQALEAAKRSMLRAGIQEDASLAPSERQREIDAAAVQALGEKFGAGRDHDAP